ncbi:MAG TPA: hypothetical protein PKK06_13200 [Phycisphaerae bacterium]|nr:hypothetical protein [Phycisphaerae bacterium]HNU45691.1 hypothetical protein [Phycisphaerae bacterium]
MTLEQFNTQVQELVAVIRTLPTDEQAELMALVEETLQRQAATSADLARARNALDDWRLLQKYLVFDAEATLREARARQERGDERDETP